MIAHCPLGHSTTQKSPAVTSPGLGSPGLHTESQRGLTSWLPDPALGLLIAWGPPEANLKQRFKGKLFIGEVLRVNSGRRGREGACEGRVTRQVTPGCLGLNLTGGLGQALWAPRLRVIWPKNEGAGYLTTNSVLSLLSLLSGMGVGLGGICLFSGPQVVRSWVLCAPR